MLYCPYCGSKVHRGADFCSCGHDLKTEEVEKARTKTRAPNVKCAIHPAYPIIGVCASCGKTVCDLCRGDAAEKLCLRYIPFVPGGKLYCPSCTHRVGGIKRIFRRFLQVAKDGEGEFVLEGTVYAKQGPNWVVWIGIALYVGGGIAICLLAK